MKHSTIMAIIEKIEKGLAILETEHFGSFTVPQSILPSDIHEGAVLDISFQINLEKEAERKQSIRDIQKRLQDS